MPRRPPKSPRAKLQPIRGASTRLLGDLHRSGEGSHGLKTWSDFVRHPFHHRWLREHENVETTATTPSTTR